MGKFLQAKIKVNKFLIIQALYSVQSIGFFYYWSYTCMSGCMCCYGLFQFFPSIGTGVVVVVVVVSLPTMSWTLLISIHLLNYCLDTQRAHSSQLVFGLRAFSIRRIPTSTRVITVRTPCGTNELKWYQVFPLILLL